VGTAPLAGDGQGDLVPGGVLPDEAGQRLGAAHEVAVDRDDHVARAQPGLLGGRPALHARDLRAGPRLATHGRDRVPQPHAEVRVLGDAVLDELVDDELDEVARDREAQADAPGRAAGTGGHRGDRAVDADDPALRVEQGPAGVAGVDRCVHLDGVRRHRDDLLAG
jgi:hypothetical protein